MFVKINKEWLQNYSRRLLREVDVPENIIDDNLESFMYESGLRELEEGDYCYYGEVEE